MCPHCIITAIQNAIGLAPFVPQVVHYVGALVRR